MTDVFVKQWADFGISGMVIGALIFMLWWLGKTMMDHLRQLMEQHREERREWQTTVREASERHDKALERNTGAVIDLHRAIQDMNSRERRFKPESADVS